MADLYRIKPFSTLGWWLACSFFIWPFVVFTVGITAIPVAFAGSFLFPYGIENEVLSVILGFAAIVAIGGITGYCMSLLQRWILRSKLYWEAGNWSRWTIVGGGTGAIASVGFMLVFESILYRMYDGNGFLFVMPVFLTIVAAFQMIALRHAVKQAWLWLGANLAGGIVFAGIITSNDPSRYNPNSELLTLLFAVFAVLALGMITGFVLLFLFENKLHPMQPADKDTEKTTGTNSVWDQAI